MEGRFYSATPGYTEGIGYPLPQWARWKVCFPLENLAKWKAGLLTNTWIYGFYGSYRLSSSSLGQMKVTVTSSMPGKMEGTNVYTNLSYTWLDVRQVLLFNIWLYRRQVTVYS